MTIWVPDLSTKRGPRYLAIVNAIGEAVESGELSEGDKLLPQRDFAYRVGLTLGTVSRAFSLAQKRGLIRGEVGRGSFVCGQNSTRSGLDFRPGSSTGEIVDLSCFLPGGSRITAAISEVIREFQQEGDILSLHRYPPGVGIKSHRIAGAKWIKQLGYDVSDAETIVCPGAQQALSATLSTIANPGETILTEALTYSGVKQLSHLFHLRPEGIAIDSEGMLPDALEAACSTSQARVLYLQPSIHNPTTAVMSADRRKDIAAIARKFDLTVIEDASCATLLTDAPPPLVTLIPERTVFIVGTSKSLSPSLRTGFMTCPQDLRPRIAANMHTLSLSAAPLAAEIAARLISSSDMTAMLKLLRSDLAERHDLIREVLGSFDIQHHPASPYTWLKLPPSWRADDFSSTSKMHGVAVVSAENFAVGRISAPHDIRISVGINPQHGTFESGLNALASLLTKPPQPQDSII